MKHRSLIGIAALCLAAACGGSGSDAPASPQDTSAQPTPAPDQGAEGQPTSPSDPGPSQPPPSDPGPSQPPPSEPPAKFVVRVDCAPVNDFGYIGWAKGTLAIKNRTPDGSFIVQGGLNLRYKFIDDSETTKDVQVEGTIDRDGQYVTALVVSGAPGLESVFLVLSSGVDSHIDGPNGSPAYQTRCAASTAEVPQGSDLKPEGSVRFAVHGDGTIGVQINVVNIGNQPANGARGRVMIGTSTADAELHRWIDGAETSTANLNPGERGFIWAVLAPNALARCMHPNVVIDLDHTFQSGAPDPFVNDTAEVWTQCMTWSRPISADSMDSRRFDPTDPFLIGKTLGKIVGSYEIGRKNADGSPEHRCSHCHFAGSQRTYKPPVEEDGSGTISPTDRIGDTTWAADGWVRRFQTHPIGKPDYLKAALQQWIDDGARP